MVVMYRLQLSTLWEESLKAVVLYLRQRVVNNDICFVFNVLGLQDEAVFWAMIFATAISQIITFCGPDCIVQMGFKSAAIM